MTARDLNAIVLSPALRVLPPQMDTIAARAMLTAIALQESELRHRRQIAAYRGDERIYGPARGWFMFEIVAVRAVLRHEESAVAAEQLLTVLGYRGQAPEAIHAAIEHNDVLAAGFARLLLYTDARLPPQSADGAIDGWLQYLACWRPGRPHQDKWAGNFSEAWSVDWASVGLGMR